MGKNAETRRERAAYHEAGHAVMSILLMIPFKAVSLRQKEEERFEIRNGERVRCIYKYGEGVILSEELIKSINEDLYAGKLDLREGLILIAGPEAEKKLIGGIDEQANFAAKMDMQALMSCCRAAISPGLAIEGWKTSIMEGPLINALAKQAEAMLEENWTCVEAVADALIKYRSLTYDEIERIMDKKKGM